MSFSLGISNSPNRLGNLTALAPYLYESPYYRAWVTELALAFYEGRQDEFVYLDLVREFRNPERQQIIPYNLTKEIIDETSILYKETPIYRVVDAKTGKPLPKDQKLFEEIQQGSRYNMLMDKADRWCRLLGTVLVKVSFVDESTGHAVKSTSGGKVQYDIVHSGVYDVRYGVSPYFVTELIIGFNKSFSGFGSYYSNGVQYFDQESSHKARLADLKRANEANKTPGLDRIYWSPTVHSSTLDNGKTEGSKNPYGIIPAVPFFNADPAHYYFLPVNEPLLYANHALNMRMTDLNHIAKFQSFGIPVISGAERPVGVRQGRPVDDFNTLRAGAAQRFGGLAGSSGAVGWAGISRNTFQGFGSFRDGNAESNSLGFSFGPDTAITVGEKGDFRFEHPKADITGLVKSIETMMDMVRVNHGLQPKYRDKAPASGYAIWLEKSGVIDQNKRRSQLFMDREQQLFQVTKRLWNTHYDKSGDRRFSENAKLEITYIEPKFPVDPKTNMETIIMESKILNTGDRSAIKQLYPWMTDEEVSLLIEKRRKDKEEQTAFETKLSIDQQNALKEVGLSKPSESDSNKPEESEEDVQKPKIDNRAKHAEKSSVQPNKNGDLRPKE